MYSVDQVNIPPELGTVMKQYTKAVLRDKPTNVYQYSANFFAALCGKIPPFDPDGTLSREGGFSSSLNGVKSQLSADMERDPSNGRMLRNPSGGSEVESRTTPSMVSEQEAIQMIFQKYDNGEGVVSRNALRYLLLDIQETLELEDGELPSPEEIIALLQCNTDEVDLQEIRQLLFEAEEE